jgi:hypothetical protein
MGYASLTKTCNGCKQTKSFECFSVVKPGSGDRNNLASRCKECRAKKNSAWHHNNLSRAKKNRTNYYIKNKEKEQSYAKEWREFNKDRHAENNKKWKAENPSINAKNASTRKAKKLQATPAWLTTIHHAQIQEMYDIASAKTMQTGIKYHVDHIFPLQGKTFSGLNVPWNLQVISGFDNISKKNKFPKEHIDMCWDGV